MLVPLVRAGLVNPAEAEECSSVFPKSESSLLCWYNLRALRTRRGFPDSPQLSSLHAQRVNSVLNLDFASP